MVDSHIQMTRSLLKGFYHRTYEGKKVYCLFVSDNVIREVKINDLDVEFGYYSDEVEQALDVGFENSIGKIFKNVRSFSKTNEIKITANDQKSILMFFTCCYFRGERLRKYLNENSYTSISPISGNETVSFFLMGPEQITYFNNYRVNIFINKSETGLVLPRSCFYPFINSISTEVQYIMPLNPHIAMHLIHKSDYYKVFDDKTLTNFNAFDNNAIEFLNRQALYWENDSNNLFIVAKKTEELHYLQELLKRDIKSKT